MAEETERHLLEFAQYNWRNKAFRQMTFDTLCPKGAFCKKDKPDPYQNLNEPGTVELLKHVEEVLSTYTAVGTCVRSTQRIPLNSTFVWP